MSQHEIQDKESYLYRLRHSLAHLLAEAVLLGNVSYRCGKEIAWDAQKGTTNVPEADQYLGRDYRKGWELPKA